MQREVHLLHPAGLPARAHVVYEPVATDIHDGDLRRLYERWLAETMNGRAVTATEILGYREIEPLAGNLMMLEVVDGEAAGRDYVYRLYGADIARRYGRDMTGRRTSELPGAVADFFSGLYAVAIERGVVIHSLHTPPPEVNVSKWERLIFPLGSPMVRKILVVNIPKGVRRQVLDGRAA